MEPSQGEIVPDLLIDACGWAAVVDAGLNIDLEIERTIGPSNWIVLMQVKKEHNLWKYTLLRLHFEKNLNFQLKPILQLLLATKTQ